MVRLKLRHNQSGFSLIAVMSGALIAGITVMLVGRSLLFHGQTERGIASNRSLGLIGDLYTLLTHTNTVCNQTGLVGKNLSPLLLPTPLPVSITLNYPAGGGSPQPAIQAGMIFGDTRKIQDVRIASLNSIGTAGGISRYLAKVEIATEIVGKATSLRNPVQKYDLEVGLDGTNKIVDCYGSGGGGGTPPPTFMGAQCPVGQRLQGIDASGTPNCQPAFNMMGGYFMTSSSEYYTPVLDNPTGAASTTYIHAGATKTLYFGNCGANTYTGKCSCPAGWNPIVLMQQSFACDPADPFGNVYCGYHYPSTNPLGTGHWNTNWLVHAVTVICTNGAWQ